MYTKSFSFTFSAGVPLLLWLLGGVLLLTYGLQPERVEAVPLLNDSVAQSQGVPIPPQDIDPSSPSKPLLPETPPSLPPSPEELVPSVPETVPGISPDVLVEEITVTGLQFEGNSLFSSAALEAELLKRLSDDSTTVLLPDMEATEPADLSEWRAQTLSFSEILQLAAIVADIYHDEGYDTSGAVVRIPAVTQQDRQGGIVIEVIEGSLDSVELVRTEGSSTRLRSGYVRSRLGVTIGEPLNVDRLQEQLQLLQLDPLIERISAELNAGATTGSSLLMVQYQEAPTFDTVIDLNNGRSPSVGSFQRQVRVSEANLLGSGDRIEVSYANTEGSDTLNANYTLPVNLTNGTLDFAYSTAWNDVIEAPFNDVDNNGRGPDIESNSSTYEISYRQPLSRSIENRTFQEFVLGMSASLRQSQSFLLDQPFPLSPGADAEGKTDIFALRFSQDWTHQDAKQVIALRSQFSLGLNTLGSTINPAVAGVDARPDSEFFAWRGQGQWVRRLGDSNLLLVRGSAQLADQALLSAEQFGIGGLGSVRGYRQDQLLTDNGMFASAEVRFPIVQVPEWRGTLQLAPFVDVGTGWDSGERPNSVPNFLAAAGVGLQWDQGDDLTARLDFGLPLVSVEADEGTWQESGFYFSLTYNLF